MAGTWLVSCGPTDPIHQLEIGERGRAVKVLDGDTFALNTGLVVRLACVTAPNLSDVHGKESARILEDLLVGREVILFYGGLTRDKFGRALAQVKTADKLGPNLWINQSLVQQGAGWMEVYSDTAIPCHALEGDEVKAIQNKEGLWRKREYKPTPVSACCSETGPKYLLGEVIAVEQMPNPKTCKLTLSETRIYAEYAGDCIKQHIGVPFEARLRGYFDGTLIDLKHPLNIRLSQSNSE